MDSPASAAQGDVKTDFAVRLAGVAAALPGYTLHERLGSGGCGDVWRATAPGGLNKAVKIIANVGSNAEACGEVKAMRRVTELHHPFLLSVERIDQHGDFVFIVTELAELSLRDRFRQCREQGLSGINRDELLGYLREAAEALDYLWQRHSLQHLDVKPENLLVVSGHVKVADFGLLKRLSDNNVSLVAGLTPRYAPPELFDGRPNPTSDQYSLAIVYQELASGKYPFDGRTTAQLASQHLHVKPDLSSLTPTERFAVGRALSKDPKGRFASCLEFVQRLVPKAGTQILAPGTTFDGKSQKSSDSDPALGVSQHDGRTVMVASVTSQKLPPLPLAGARPDYRPTVFIGVGHTGGRVLKRLRRLLADQCRGTAPLPALSLVYLDTDMEAIREVTRNDGELPLAEAETLLLPLYATATYRERKVLSVPSISRRWIYNIPRSKRTEGVRMLGRLALVDHLDQVMDRLRRTLVAATGLDAATETAKAIGLPFLPVDPRVFIVGSLGGGTSSGMLIDVAYLVRQVLAELGFSDDHVVGLLTYASRAGTSRELTAANAYACLSELDHFSQGQNDYPGEPLLGLAGFREARGAFADAYFVDLGDNLSEAQFDDGVHSLASYLQLGTTSAASAFFDLSRRTGMNDQPGLGLSLRSFVLESLARSEGGVAARYVDPLCRLVAHRWRGSQEAVPSGLGRKQRAASSSAPSTAPALAELSAAAADRCLAQFDVNSPSLASRLQNETAELLQDDLHAYGRALVDDALAASPAAAIDSTEGRRALLKPLHAAFAAGETTCAPAGGSVESTLRSLIWQVAEATGHEVGPRLSLALGECVNNPKLRVAGARDAGSIVRRRLAELAAAANDEASRYRSDGESIFRILTEPPKEPTAATKTGPPDWRAHLHEYADRLLAQLLAGGLAKTLNVIDAYVHGGLDELRTLWKELGQLTDEFALEQPEQPQAAGSPEQPLLTRHLWNQSMARLTEMVDADLTATYATDGQSILEALRRGGERRKQLIVAMRESSRSVLRTLVGELVQSHLTQSWSASGQLPAPLGDAIHRAESIDSFVGARRLFVTLSTALNTPQHSRHIEQTAGIGPNVLNHVTDEVIVGFEVEGISPDAVRRRLLSAAPCCDELADRLHGRCDVVWSSNSPLG